MEVVQQDHFDRLPDALLLLIFNKLLDVKPLSRCLLVCKRFSILIPQTNALFVAIPPRIPPSKPPNGFCLPSLRVFLSKPFKPFRRLVASNSPSTRRISAAHHSLNNALNKFQHVKSIHIQFPFSGNGIDLVGGDCLMKWKAEFGGQLKSCIILSATSYFPTEVKQLQEQEEERFLTDDELRVRIIWTISCLIAASARHHFLKKILLDHPSLESVLITDEKKQGKMSMGREELAEMRGYIGSFSASKLLSSMERTKVPDLSITLWYAPELELPVSGYRMKGATLVVIRPVDDGELMRKGLSDGELMGSGFDGDHGEEIVFAEAVKEMMKMKKSYMMTMNSF
ncbi:F-box protein At4g18380-like [Mangifera indica]|uniref:F-box protein At4g18380-like n=1 Tax=Mangifera indica TaxID=29780 RepID=UPI001CF9505D|nr:F-box protein At4g18380-like [Mangifera indica]